VDILMEKLPILNEESAGGFQKAFTMSKLIEILRKYSNLKTNSRHFVKEYLNDS
jgi:hypothetical protein